MRASLHGLIATPIELGQLASVEITEGAKRENELASVDNTEAASFEAAATAIDATEADLGTLVRSGRRI